MLIVKQREGLSKVLTQTVNLRKTVGFVPTMGALHQGHISLIKSSKKNCDFTVCSIFVNPRQFNNPDDLLKYPQTIDRDILLLEEAGCDLLFFPDEKVIYGNYRETEIALAGLEGKFEGASRPGHFKGVATVVKILFELVKPHKAFFGQKDLQQTLVIESLIRQFNLPVQLFICPTERENDGLAMSSRNVRLNADERINSTSIYKAIQHVLLNHSTGLAAALQQAEETINNSGLRTDYIKVVDRGSFEEVKKTEPGNHYAVIVAAYAGDVRLIDNEVFMA